MKNSAGQILGFHRSPKNIVGRFLSVTSLMIVSLSTKLTFIQNTRILFPQSRAPKKFILKIFTEYFVVCPVELQGINNMLICPILSPYFSGLWSWTEYQCQNDHALVVCDHVDGGIRLSGFVLAGSIAKKMSNALFWWTMDGLSVSQ